MSDKLKDLKLSPAKKKQAETLTQKLLARLDARQSAVEKTTWPSRMDAIAADWGIPVGLLAKQNDYRIIAEILGHARTAMN